jgi:hypothetical protein
MREGVAWTPTGQEKKPVKEKPWVRVHQKDRPIQR